MGNVALNLEILKHLPVIPHVESPISCSLPDHIPVLEPDELSRNYRSLYRMCSAISCIGEFPFDVRFKFASLSMSITDLLEFHLTATRWHAPASP